MDAQNISISVQTEKPSEDQKDEEVNTGFQWKHPDLSFDSHFFKQQVKSLKSSSQTFPNPLEIYEEGIEILSIHQNNYNTQGQI